MSEVKKPPQATKVVLGPRGHKTRKSEGLQRVMESYKAQVSFQEGAHDFLVQSHGIRLVHFRAIPDPRGMTSRGDNHAVGGGGVKSSDGFIYKEVGIVRAFFSNNTSNVNAQPVGELVGAVAFLTLPDTYEERPDCPVLVHPNDRFYMLEIETRVVTSQFVEANSVGIDRLTYPATCVEHLIDADGIEYTENTDFEIVKDGTEAGAIKWLGQRRPGWNASIGKGKVYSIRYRYTPFFIINRLIHEIRVSLQSNLATGERAVKRMPYEVEVYREYVFMDRNRDSNEPETDPRYEQAPSSGGQLGPQ